MLISTALLLDSIIRNSVCTPAKLPCRRVEVGYENLKLYFKENFLKIYFVNGTLEPKIIEEKKLQKVVINRMVKTKS
jgi:hypothetical protein